MVGLAAGVLGAKEVLLTDLPYALPNMELNVEHHKELCADSRIVCHALDWYDPPSFEDLGEVMSAEATKPWIPQAILVADCVWMQELVEPLLSTLEKLACRPQQKVLISYQRRGKSTHEEFWHGLHTRFEQATVTEVDVSPMGLSKPDVIHLLVVEFGD